MPRTISYQSRLSKDLETLAKGFKKRGKKKRRKEEPIIKTSRLIPSASTVFNCACTDNYRGALPLGKIMNVVGDSQAGKTMFSLNFFAEMSLLKRFKDYRFIYDDAETANEFNIGRLFGSKVANRMEAPAIDEDDDPFYSRTIEDFDLFIHDAIDEGEPFLYILDSWDAIGSEDDDKKLQENRELRRKGNKTKGGYYTAKQKKASQILSGIANDLERTNSGLIVISQTRDNLGFGFEQKTRSGGNALRFYSSIELWLSMLAKIKDPSKKRVIGNNVKVKIKKNKITGKLREAEFPIYYDYGVDDITSCVRFLVSEGAWKKSGKSINSDDFADKMPEKKLVEFIEENNMEKGLKRLVGEKWQEIEDDAKLNRKRRY